MHYCQACDTAQLMEPSADAAVCAACGRTDPVARRADLFVVTGASGAGKTTVFEPLLAELAGRCMVFDVDWLIDPLTRQAGGVDWVAFRDAWLHVAHGVAQNGLPTMLLGPFIPEHLADLPGRRWVADIHFVTLDCDDDERRRRIEARPAWARPRHRRTGRVRPLAAGHPPDRRLWLLFTGGHGTSDRQLVARDEPGLREQIALLGALPRDRARGLVCEAGW
jgi:hypothetical protein